MRSLTRNFFKPRQAQGQATFPTTLLACIPYMFFVASVVHSSTRAFSALSASSSRLLQRQQLECARSLCSPAADALMATAQTMQQRNSLDLALANPTLKQGECAAAGSSGGTGQRVERVVALLHTDAFAAAVAGCWVLCGLELLMVVV